ncbi:hypothetical protein SEA_KLEVEY_78 [Arthrobacter phage Klevey]|uniref:Uncharacterized protein n=1 Tax=Arthrobacter phage Klevey TaxID=2867481 RepID=A0AAE9BRR2_9CAUD|nr:hypothetical protein SEA_KLEVEY_78 [Arthrobacter phage Klevey]
MSNDPFAEYCTSRLSDLADEKLVAAVRARLEAGTAYWALSQSGSSVLFLIDQDSLRHVASLEVVHYPGEGDDFEASEALLAEAGL